MRKTEVDFIQVYMEKRAGVVGDGVVYLCW